MSSREGLHKRNPPFILGVPEFINLPELRQTLVLDESRPGLPSCLACFAELCPLFSGERAGTHCRWCVGREVWVKVGVEEDFGMGGGNVPVVEGVADKDWRGGVGYGFERVEFMHQGKGDEFCGTG